LLSPCEKDGSFYFGSVFWIVFIAIIYCTIFRETATAKKTAERGWRIVQLTLLSSAFLFAAAGIRAKDAGFL
jgi:uncharacterized membrane protein YsdA (DUF1294 family)